MQGRHQNILQSIFQAWLASTAFGRILNALEWNFDFIMLGMQDIERKKLSNIYYLSCAKCYVVSIYLISA